MSRIDKLLSKVFTSPGNIKWAELERLLAHYGYEKKEGNGSRVKFHSAQYGLIILHKPHPGNIVDTAAIKDIVAKFEENGIKP